ncbi:hypothetical protein HK102_000703 [Quaeritorhiza haematococci]|nr:hypothetical protein HK102_000703 [Quaeritorhiza haematococci]
MAFKSFVITGLKTIFLSALLLQIVDARPVDTASQAPDPAAASGTFDLAADRSTHKNHQPFKGALYGLVAPPVYKLHDKRYVVSGDPQQKNFKDLKHAIEQSCKIQRSRCDAVMGSHGDECKKQEEKCLKNEDGSESESESSDEES